MKYLICFASLLTPFLAVAEDYPQRKAGLWEISTAMGGPIPAQKVKQCIDENTDAEMMQMAQGMNNQGGMNCAKNDMRKEGSKYVVETDCTMNNTRAITKTVLSGNFSSSYSGETSVKYEPPIPGMPEMKMKISARWLGPCPAGQNPGDIVMPDGSKMTLDALKKMGG